ncbi:peptidoglycan recognition protein family protein [Nocardia aurea]|uniref:peptidoglycan recognition protein family protein n=1 Tax=Nocardia aurea TaxID=2144174 RepID=UPI001300B4F5|nr:N-acetylmuramoyl-L-alanine amidase [Nocardia aurea]
MDTYDSSVAGAFSSKESSFFGGAAHDDDTVISVLSPFGNFKVQTYPNQGNSSDVHYVVFFHNKQTKDTFEVHGAIAREFISMVRAQSGVQDFPIADTRQYQASTADSISYFSQYTLRWESATNRVIRKFYKPYDPAQATVAARLHDYDPVKKDRLVAFTEEYNIASPSLNFSNWKDEPGMGKYNASIGIRSGGMPTQILLHETAAFSDMSIPNVREERTSTGGSFFPIPHFCVNNLSTDGKGSIIQFVDIATNVPHGESTNPRSIGIEFVNAPIEAFDENRRPVFNLTESTRGIYLKTKLSGLSKLFIPLEFSTEPLGGYYELAVRKDRLLNFDALKVLAGPTGKKVVEIHGENLLIKFAKSSKFENLATLVSEMVGKKLVRGVDDLTTESFWKPLVRVDGKLFYIFEHGWEERREGRHFFFDLLDPGVLTHLLAGGHVDGGLQGLYLYLKFVKKVPIEAILQLMITFLTSSRTAAEVGKIRLTSKMLSNREGTKPPPTPIHKLFGDVLELDEPLIGAVANP